MQAGGRRFEPVRLHHFQWCGEAMARRSFAWEKLCSRPARLPVLYDIVKRRSVRTSLARRRVGRGMLTSLCHRIGPTTAGHRSDLEKLVFLADPRRLRWALAMRMIKCLKGDWWMPLHAQAMKDVVRCDKPRGAANKL